MEYTIDLRDVVQDFGETRVLDHITLRARRGEILGLLGPSGAGKTTLIKILTGQLCRTAGSVRVLGTDSDVLPGELRRKLGVMMDGFGLYERLSVYENLKLFAEIYGISTQKVEQLLKKVGLYDARKTPAAKLSRGMRGRLLLARAVLNDAEILFLDEPTSGLDPAAAKGIHRLLTEEQKRGATIFLTTHNMAEAELLCDNVALLNRGEIVDYGSPKEICKKYSHKNRFRIWLKDGRQLELDDTAAPAVGELFRQELVSAIHSTEPDLETVFLELTGRRL